VNINVLIFAAPFIAATVLLLVYRKALRIAAVTGGFAILCVLVAVTPARMVLVNLASSGIGIAVVIALVVAAALAVTFDMRGHHKKALNGRQGQGHHMRPFIGVSVLAVTAVLTIAIWHSYTSAASHGGGQVITTILHPGA
jgi:hypothetical protein